MLAFLRKWLVVGVFSAAAAYVGFFGVYLREFASDDLRKIGSALGVKFPLQEPRIEINLPRMTLSIYEGDVLLKRYDIGYGAGAPGRLSTKETGTPLGSFTIIAKRKQKDVWDRGSRFLILDYPNPEIAERAVDAGLLDYSELEEVLAAHREARVPRHAGRLSIPLGIQGNFFFFRGRRFTDGSVALSNGDLNELYEHVPVGTPVVITDQQY